MAATTSDGASLAPLSSDPRSYLLSAAESRRIFATQILPRELPADVFPASLSSDPSTRRQPLAVLIVGQTGSGKTRIAPAVLAALTRLRSSAAASSFHLPHQPSPRPAHFIADTYKAYHPQYARLVRERAGLASPAAGADARRWLAMACRAAVAGGCDALVESACRHPDDFAELVRIFREGDGDAGGGGDEEEEGKEKEEWERRGSASVEKRPYRVEIAVLAVPEPLSRLGILVRYYEGLPEAAGGGATSMLPARLTPRKVHDDSYRGLEAAAAWLQGEGGVGVVMGDEGGAEEGGREAEGRRQRAGRPLADRVVLVRRGNLVAWAWRWHGSGGGGGGGAAVEGGDAKEANPASAGLTPALARERRRPLTAAEAAAAVEQMERLRGRNGDAGLQTQLGEIENMLTLHGPTGEEANQERFPPLKPLRFVDELTEADVRDLAQEPKGMDSLLELGMQLPAIV